MVRRSRVDDPEAIRKKLIALLTDFEQQLHRDDLREQVRHLVPGYHLLRDLGGSLMPRGTKGSGLGRLLAYLRMHPGQVIDGAELMVVAGIVDYPRRIRQLRIQEGWPILSGYTAKDLRSDPETNPDELPPVMAPDQYLLQHDQRDRKAAERWKIANKIRKSRASIQEKLLQYFRSNLCQPVTSEELRYVANNRSEWARRTRELRTEQGWPIVTRFNGDPKLPVGVYVLERDEQAPAHDRHINELTRREVMARDSWKCRWKGCGWSKSDYDRDHRYLELHHIEHHVQGGSNTADNLVTLCNLHHDEVHRGTELNITAI